MASCPRQALVPAPARTKAPMAAGSTGVGLQGYRYLHPPTQRHAGSAGSTGVGLQVLPGLQVWVYRSTGSTGVGLQVLSGLQVWVYRCCRVYRCGSTGAVGSTGVGLQVLSGLHVLSGLQVWVYRCFRVYRYGSRGGATHGTSACDSGENSVPSLQYV
eukprot:7987845-Pyramimonas_sp.AAC.1